MTNTDSPISHKGQGSDKSGEMVARIIREFIRPYTATIFLAFFFMLIASMLTAAVAQMFQPVLDVVMEPDNSQYVLPIAAALGGAFILRGFVSYIHTILMNKASQSIIADIQTRLFDHFMTMDLSFFHKHPSGHLISRVVSDVNIMRMAITDTLTGLVKSSLTLIFLVGVMFYQDWRLALFAILVFPFAALFVAKLGRRLRKVAISTQQELGNLSERLSQTFLGIRQVKAYNAEEYESQRAGNAVNTVRDLAIKALRIGTLSTPVNEFLVGITVFGIILYGGMQINAGEMTAGQLGAFIAAFTLAYEPMKKLAKLNNNLQTGLGAAERVFDMLDTRPDMVEKQTAINVTFERPEIQFVKASFSYPESNDRAIEGITFTMKAGEVTALVGPSGSGKSTILNLIPRFYDLDNGEILIDDINIQDMTIKSLRKNIALVSQDITIFDDTVFANIAYGNPHASHEDVARAAKLAAADEFVLAMPDGYGTRLGENGAKLSGGQKQRISIARAILKDAPILLLDEATSALDTQSERLIQESLEELQKGRTTLVIAHRLSTIQNANKIVVMDSGHIIEQGTHKELLKKKGAYARMYNGTTAKDPGLFSTALKKQRV